MAAAKKRRRAERFVYVYRHDNDDSYDTSEISIVLSRQPPRKVFDAEHVCANCAHTTGPSHYEVYPVAFEQDVCFDGWLAMTKFELKPGECKRVKITVEEV